MEGTLKIANRKLQTGNEAIAVNLQFTILNLQCSLPVEFARAPPYDRVCKVTKHDCVFDPLNGVKGDDHHGCPSTRNVKRNTDSS